MALARQLSSVAPSPVKILAHHVHEHGAPARVVQHPERGAVALAPPHVHRTEGHDPTHAHAHALALSKARPLEVFHVREVPSHTLGADKQWAPNVGNVHGLHERVVAVYQGGKQIPIT